MIGPGTKNLNSTYIDLAEMRGASCSHQGAREIWQIGRLRRSACTYLILKYLERYISAGILHGNWCKIANYFGVNLHGADEAEIALCGAGNAAVSVLRSAKTGCLTLLRAPFDGKPDDVAQLDRPNDYIGGDNELVVEDGALIHHLRPPEVKTACPSDSASAASISSASFFCRCRST